jgi:hypothetical protein
MWNEESLTTKRKAQAKVVELWIRGKGRKKLPWIRGKGRKKWEMRPLGGKHRNHQGTRRREYLRLLTQSRRNRKGRRRERL